MILQVIYSDRTKAYIDIGDVFSITEKEISDMEFNAISKHVFGEGEKGNLPECYAFITHHQGSKTQPLYKGFDYTLISNNGVPFKSISLSLR